MRSERAARRALCPRRVSALYPRAMMAPSARSRMEMALEGVSGWSRSRTCADIRPYGEVYDSSIICIEEINHWVGSGEVR